MANIENSLLHRKLYEYLKTLHEANPNLLFWVSDSQDGLWFKHSAVKDNIIIFTMFEEGFQKYNLRIMYDSDTQNWVCAMPLPDSKPVIQQIESLGFTFIDGGWRKALLPSDDFLKPLKDFIKNEKPLIEAFLEKKPILGNKNRVFKKQIEQIEQFYKRPHIQEYYRLAAEKSKIHLPFAVSRLEVIDFQGITNLVIEHLPADKQWIFLTGENGFGKTSILKAMAKALVGDEALLEPLPKNSRLIINGYHNQAPFYYQASPNQMPQKAFPIAVYGAARFHMTELDPLAFYKSKYSKITYSLFNDDGKMMNVNRLLMDAERDNIALFERLKKTFLTIIPQLADIRSEIVHKNREIKYYEKSEQGDLFPPVALTELAAGYRGILTLIGDIVQRLTEHPNNSLEDLQGIVLIDEFDAHLHPKYQYELPNLLSEVFPKIQFIVATHSPLTIMGVKPNTSAVLTVHRTKSEGITVERLDDDIDIQRLTVNALLTSDIFNFNKIFTRGATIEMIEPVDNYKQIKEMTRLDKLLQLKKVLKSI
jgi:energy-coupling factor transporter ATP-binding protein EcfA2